MTSNGAFVPKCLCESVANVCNNVPVDVTQLHRYSWLIHVYCVSSYFGEHSAKYQVSL